MGIGGRVMVGQGWILAGVGVGIYCCGGDMLWEMAIGLPYGTKYSQGNLSTLKFVKFQTPSTANFLI